MIYNNNEIIQYKVPRDSTKKYLHIQIYKNKKEHNFCLLV
jgi:hypothetical protein